MTMIKKVDVLTSFKLKINFYYFTPGTKNAKRKAESADVRVCGVRGGHSRSNSRRFLR